MIKEINKNIVSNVDKEVKKAVKQMGKVGFVNIDGSIYRYDVGTSNFVEADPQETIKKFYNFYTPRWDIVSNARIKELLLDNVPGFTSEQIHQFNKYANAEKIIINNELIKDELKKVLDENNSYKNTNLNLKGKFDIASQLLVLRNKDIFTDGVHLYEYKYRNFTRIHLNDLMRILNKELATNTIRFDVKMVNKYKDNYRSDLSNAKLIIRLLREKQRKETTIKDCQQSYDKVLKVVDKYS